MRQNVRPIRIIHHVYNIRGLLECRPLHRFLLGTISFGLYVWQAMMQSSCDKERERRKRSPRTRSSQGWAAFRILLWSPCPTATIKTTISDDEYFPLGSIEMYGGVCLRDAFDRCHIMLTGSIARGDIGRAMLPVSIT